MKYFPSPYIRQCPLCASEIWGDRLGMHFKGGGKSILWTDGLTTGFWMISSGLLARCDRCKCIFPFAEAEDAPRPPGHPARWARDDAWPANEWLTFLDMLLDDDPYEVLGRYGLWLTENEPYRALAPGELPPKREREPRELQNMGRLLELWQRVPPKHPLLILELLRQMGRFEEALVLGDTMKPHVTDNYRGYWRHIIGRCRLRDPWVRRFRSLGR